MPVIHSKASSGVLEGFGVFDDVDHDWDADAVVSKAGPLQGSVFIINQIRFDPLQPLLPATTAV